MVFIQARNSSRYQTQVLQDAVAVLEQNGIQLNGVSVPENSGQVFTVARAQQEEPALAAALLGSVQAEDLGSGRHLYRSELGAAEFRSNGNFSFDFSENAPEIPPGSSAPEHAKTCLAQLGFEYRTLSVPTDVSNTLVVCQLWQELPVFSCTVTLTYEDNRLHTIAGERLMGTPVAVSAPPELISPATALLLFLSGTSDMGDVCREIAEIQPGYLLATGDSTQLLPAWHISTDTGTYLLNMLTGELLRSSF